MLIDAIKTHALEAAQSGDWSAVAEALQAISVTAEPRLCYAVESGETIEAAGDDPTAVLGYMLQDPNGNMLFQKLASTAGVMWAHDRTRQWLAWFVSQGRISQAGAEALIQLSAPVSYPHADVTADQCSEVWAADQLQMQRKALRTRLNAAWNQIGTVEQAEAIAEFRAIADELEAG
jgi:hypothetical protein